jgi:hypothetical protein
MGLRKVKKMNSIVPDRPAENANRRNAVPMAMAERELTAFFSAVMQLFGREQAELSAEDWLHELTEIEGSPSSTGAWRSITAKASSRLADRVKALSLSTQFTSA